MMNTAKVNEATMKTTTDLHPTKAFAADVRAALSDLPADEVDELTDGLEADLAERAADEETPNFGDPVAYANELRSAAGLPPRTAHRSTGLDGILASTWDEFVSGLRELHKHPLIARLAAFFVALRPLWWAFRAWMFYGILTWLFGVSALAFNPATFVLGVGSLIVSVQFGRDKWQPRTWMRTTLRVTNILLVLTVPLALLATSSAFGSEANNAYASVQAQSTPNYSGLEYNGRQITNIFAYDASGKPLTDVQLFDQKGTPLNTVPDTAAKVTDSPYLVPNNNVVGHRGWNIYPLETVTQSQLDSNGYPKANAKPKPSMPTFLIVQPLASPKSTKPTATPTPAPTN